MSVFVGVDPALQKIGLCVLVDGHVDTLYLVLPPRTLKGPERLAYLRDETKNVLTAWEGKITKAAIEAQSLGSLGDIDQLGQINGALQVLLVDLGASVVKVPPANLKKFVTSSAQADKGRMRRATLSRWGIDIPNDDLCDAHGLARFAEEVTEQRSTLRHQVEAVFSVLHKKKRPRRIKKLFTKTL